MLGTSVRTIKRYKSGITRPPVITIRFLTILAGDISQIDTSFTGWKIKNGHLISPNNELFNSSRLEHVRTEFAINRDNKADIRKLKDEIIKYKEMLPDAEIIPISRFKTMIKDKNTEN